MLKLILSLIIAAHAELSAQNSQKQLYIIGGAGDPDTRVDTIFDPAFKTILEFLPNSDWQATVRYDGGHDATKQMLDDNNAIIPDQDSLSAGSFNKALDKMKNQAETLPPGAQMLVYIDSHGAEKKKGQNIITHEISVSGSSSDLNSQSGSKHVNLDGLQDVIAIANKRGVKIAILDMSCHSGNTLALANDKTCVISATAPNLYGYSKFTERFVKKMKTGHNLESIFLSTRLENGDACLPMISTTAGKTLSAQEQSLAGFLTYRDNDDRRINKLSPLIYKEALSCEGHDSPLSRLQKLKKNLAVAFGNFQNGSQDPDLLALQKLVEDYQKLQTEIENELNMKFPKLDKIETIELNYKEETGQTTTLSNKYDWKNLISTNWEKEVQAFRNQAKKEQNTTKRLNASAMADFLQNCSLKKAEILSKYPDLKNYQNFIDSAVEKIGNSEKMANKIAAAERQVYQKLYEKESKKSSSNACKDFVL